MEPGTRAAMIRSIAWLARGIVGLALVVAGTTKAIHPATFITDIWSYRLVPEAWAYWIAAFLPWLEIVVGAALITGRQRQGAQAIAAALLLVFLGALLVSWSRGLDIACGCFGGGPATAGATDYPWLVGRDLVLLACLAFGWFADRRPAVQAPSR
ncbi:MAG: DoxX family protein [Opitutaceae bacterium]|nr:DoxX family protein [Opitutaceae bacterium]